MPYAPHLFTSMPSASSVMAYAHDRVDAVDGFVTGMQNAVLTLVAPTITPDFPTGGSAPAVETAPLPAFQQPVWTAPGLPLPFTDVLTTSDLNVDPFDDDPPVFSFGAAPVAPDLVLPDAPTVDFDFSDPTLVVNLPAPPSLLSISVSPFGGINMPTFDADEPVLNIVEPSIREYTPGAQYTSALLTATQASLQARISGGGTGLGQPAESAMWDRGREREFRSQADAIAQLEQMEGLGYMLPNGAYMDARLKLTTEINYQNVGHSREVMIKSAELELDNVKHALTTATQLEGQLIDYTNQTEQRLFEASKYVTEAGVQIYNAKVQAFTAMIEAYRAKVTVYTAQIQAEVSKVDAYRAEIAAEEAKAQVNTALVAQYSAQVQAALSAVDIYRAQIAGIQAKADIEKTKVEAFGAQVQAYGAQVNAYTASIEGFRASLGAETAKQDAYRTQVQAFQARVDAATSQINGRVSAFRARIESKGLEYDAYKSAIQAETGRIQSIAAISGVVADAYKSQVAGISSYNDVLTKQWQATVDQNERVAEIGINAAKANADLYVTTRSLALDATKMGAQVSAQIGAAALNALNFSASMSSSDSYGATDGTSTSISTSTSSSVSQQHSDVTSDSQSISYSFS